MKYTKIENARWTSEDQTTIECDVYFEGLNGPAPFTANPDDTEDHGRAIFNELLGGKHGDIAAFTPVQPNSVVVAVPAPTLDELKILKIAEIAAWRYAEETGGIVVDGLPITTDRDSQVAVTSAYANLKNGLISSVNWKTANGSWVTLELAEFEQIAKQVALHVQACFTQERQLVELVNKATSGEAVAAVVAPQQ